MTERYDVKRDIVKALKSVPELKRVSAEYPNTWSSMPAAIYSTKAKPNKLDISENETLTEWTVKIDLYGNKSLTTVQQKVIDALKTIGFRNTETDDNNNETFKRSIMTFKGVVDNRTLLVYQ